MADSSVHNPVGTKFIVLTIILLVLLVPLYVAALGVVYWNYGEYYAKAAFNDPKYLFTAFKTCLSYWQANHSSPRYPLDSSIKLFAPPGASLFFSLTLLYMMRAPLIDFRPFKKKETLHG